MKPPFKDCRIVGHGISAKRYLAAAVREDGSHTRRGDADFVMSRGELMEFARCPSRWLAGYREDGNDSTDWGTLIDVAFLSNDFDKLYAVSPKTYFTRPSEDRKSKTPFVPEEKPWNNNATVCREWNTEQEMLGKSVININDSGAAFDAVKKLWCDSQVEALIETAELQTMITGTYVDPETALEVPLKIMIDIVPTVTSPFFGKCLADFKTAKNASVREWVKAVFNHDYDCQASLYTDLYVAATGEDRDSFLHVVQESFPPYQIGKRLLSQEFIQIGRNKYLTALRRYCECLKSGIWPGYDEGGLNGWTLSEPEHWMATL